MLYQKSYLALSNTEIFYFPPYKSIFNLRKKWHEANICVYQTEQLFLLLTNATNPQLYIALSLFETACVTAFKYEMDIKCKITSLFQ